MDGATLDSCNFPFFFDIGQKKELVHIHKILPVDIFYYYNNGNHLTKSLLLFHMTHTYGSTSFLLLLLFSSFDKL